MKQCRFCAEEIKDEAIICRFCGRSQTDATGFPDAVAVEPPAGRNPWLVPGILGGVVVLAIIVTAVALVSGGRHGRRSILPLTAAESAAVSDSLRVIRDSFPAFATLPGEGADSEAQAGPVVIAPPPPPPPPPPAPPANGDVADIPELKIAAGQYHYFGMEITDPRPCHVRGRVETTEGGRHDTDVMVLDVDGFTNFQYNRPFDAVFAARRTAAVTLDVALPGPGTYYLVLSNRFSTFTGKKVVVENVHWVCSDELASPEASDTAETS